MEQIYPLGTIIEYHKAKFLIVGYNFGKVQGKFQVIYNTLWYPLGYCGKDNFLALPASEKMSVVYKPDGLNTSFPEVLSQYQQAISATGDEQAYQMIQDFIKEISTQQGVPM